jgi:hypothetical protein
MGTRRKEEKLHFSIKCEKLFEHLNFEHLNSYKQTVTHVMEKSINCSSPIQIEEVNLLTHIPHFEEYNFSPKYSHIIYRTETQLSQ